MFTVKLQSLDGTISISQTKFIRQDKHGMVEWYDLQNTQHTADSGFIWVMNDEGKTVAKFDWNTPLHSHTTGW